MVLIRTFIDRIFSEIQKWVSLRNFRAFVIKKAGHSRDLLTEESHIETDWQPSLEKENESQ